jgi:hypothetical protein
MTSIQRIRVNWTGFFGGPGVSTFYATAASTLVPQLRAFFAALVSALPNTVTIHVEEGGDEIESTTGEIVGSWTTGVSANVVGTSAVAYPAAAGALVDWQCATILSGRRLRGRTFLVPLQGSSYDTSGQVTSSTRAAILAAAQALVAAAAGNLVVWQRPRKAREADGSRPAITARGGGYGSVTGASVPGPVAVLRSRRD